MYPVEIGYTSPARVLEFGDGTEQRFRMRPKAARFRLSLDGISAADVSTVRTFFEACKGRFDTTWSLTIGGTTWTGLGFMSDEFQATETQRLRWRVSLDVEKVGP
jgi:hypothetical protein